MKKEFNSSRYNVAAIDIGTNAARILIKQVRRVGASSVKMKKLQFLRVPLRLGIDVFSIGKIGDEREEMLIRTIKIFRQLLILYKVADYRACATSAFRDAKNGKKILQHIRKDMKMDIDIITGDEEARILRDCNDAVMGNLLFMDVGGGSTEISLMCNGHLIESRSFNIGTLRILANTVSETAMEEMKNAVVEFCRDIGNIQIIASGGNINKLYRLTAKRERVGDKLMVSTLSKLRANLSTLTVEQRMEQYDLAEDRADVIVPASELFLMVANAIGADAITVPTVGLADGIINELVKKRDMES